MAKNENGNRGHVTQSCLVDKKKAKADEQRVVVHDLTATGMDEDEDGCKKQWDDT